MTRTSGLEVTVVVLMASASARPTRAYPTAKLATATMVVRRPGVA